MDKKKVEILPIIKELKNNSCSKSDLNSLIENSFRIARSYVYSKRLKFYKTIDSDEISIEDLAIDAVAPLFCKQSEDDELPIVREFDFWQPPIQTEEDAFYSLNKIIAGRVEQQISHFLKEQDPFFTKILDSVNYLIKRDGYKKVSHFGKRYIVQLACEEINGKPIDQDSFENLPFSLFQNRKSFLKDIFQHIIAETEFFPAIPLNALVIRLRNLNANTHIIKDSVNDSTSNFDINELVKLGLNCALEKLKDGYISKGKLNEFESDNFKKALGNMAEDLKDGGINPGLYDYLKQHFDGLEKQEYQNRYHNILEYLLKVMKNTIRERLTEE